ncbi:MAG: hypothetical protein P4L67_02370, partial [Candidatus Pacebacteria bacterium]|nr:hypothetical protein [Candidatus Paceibacterota bacterium]
MQPKSAMTSTSAPSLHDLSTPRESSSASLTLPGALKFSGRDHDFPVWKLRMIGYLDACGVADVVLSDAHSRVEHGESVHGAGIGGDGAAASSGSSMADGGRKMELEVKTVEKKMSMESASAPNPIDLRSKKVYALLLQALQENSLVELVMHVSPGDARGVWSTLLKRFERKSTANKAHVYDKLLQTRCAEDESIDSYVARIKNLKMLLGEMGEQLPTSMLQHVLMKGLPSSYSALRQALQLQSSLTFEEIVMHLVDHQERERLKEREEAAAGDEAANYVNQFGRAKSFGRGRSFAGAGARGSSSQSNGGSQSGLNNSRVRNCWTCGKTDHLNRQCPNRRCFNCNGTGHVSAQCTSNKASESSGANGSSHSGSALSAVTKKKKKIEESESESEEEDDVAWMMLRSSGSPAVKLSRTSWVLDSGATRHLTNNKAMLSQLVQLSPPIEMQVADGESLTLRESGLFRLQLSQGRSIPLKDVAYHSSLAANLLSVNQIVRFGFTVTFYPDEAVIRDAVSREVILRVPRRGKLYVIEQPMRLLVPKWKNSPHVPREPDSDSSFAASDPAPAPTSSASSSSSTVPSSGVKLWHERYGHIGISGLRQISYADAVRGMGKLEFAPSAPSSVDVAESICADCALGKSTRAPFAAKMDASVGASRVLERVHADLCGPIQVKAMET